MFLKPVKWNCIISGGLIYEAAAAVKKTVISSPWIIAPLEML
jgi:hypothetical protein